MGAGKTTVGRHLAELLVVILDSDHEIERKTGASFLGFLKKKVNKVSVQEKQS
jgi:shikimate kinase